MANLPDIPLEHWTGYIQDQFEEKSNALMDALDFRIKTSSFGEMFPAVHPNDNPLLTSYEDQLKQDAAEQDRLRNEEMQKLEHERELIQLQQERDQLMQQLSAPPEPTPTDPGFGGQPDVQGDPNMSYPFYRGQTPEDGGSISGLTHPMYYGDQGQQAGDTRPMVSGAGKPFDPAEIEASRLSFEHAQQQKTPPPPMYEAPTPEQGMNFQDYTRQLGSMLGLGGDPNAPPAPTEPTPIAEQPIVPSEPTPVGVPDATPPPGLQNFQDTFNQELQQPQDHPQDPVSAAMWEPVYNVAGKLTKKADEIGLADAWKAVADASPTEKANATRVAIGKMLQLVPDAMTEAAAAPLTTTLGERDVNPFAKANPLASGRLSDIPGMEANPLTQAPGLRNIELPGLKGLGKIAGVSEDARYLPTDVAANILPGPGKVFDAAQWLGVAGQALENPASPATALLSAPALGLAAKFGLRGVGRLADQSIDPLEATRTSLSDEAAGIRFNELGGQPGIYATPEDVAHVKPEDYSYISSQARQKSGAPIRGAPIDVNDPSIPDTLYHVTTNAPSVRRQKMILAAGESGLGGDRGDQIVSMTTDPKIAEQIKGDLQVAAELAQIDRPGHVEWNAETKQHVPPPGWDEYQAQIQDVLGKKAAEHGFADAWQKDVDYMSRVTPQTYSAGDWLRQWYSTRNVATGVKNPIFMSDLDQMKHVLPENVDVIPVPKASLRTGALVTNFDLGKGHLDEVRIYGDVPLNEGGRNIYGETAGTPGGILPSEGAGTNLARSARFGVSAAQGAAAGGLGAAQEPGADLGDVARGAAVGAVRGAGGRLLRGNPVSGAMASNIVKAEWKMPWKPMYENQPRTPVEEMPQNIAQKAWQKLNEVRDVLSETLFDNHTYMNKLQAEARKYLGRDLTYDEMLSEHTRRNTSQAADQAIKEGLRPIWQRVGPYLDYYKEAATYRDNIAVANAKARQVYASEAAARTPSVVAAEREVRRLERLSTSANAPMDTFDRLDKARTALDEERAIREGEAWQTGGMAGEGRTFSGNLDLRQSQDRLAQIEKTLGPENWKVVSDALDDTQKFVDDYRQQLFDHGVINKPTLDALRKYEFYIPTRILERVNEERSVPVGGSINLRDRGIYEASVEGTAKEREDPINSLMKLAWESEARIAKNDAFNAFHALNAETPVFGAKLVKGADAIAKMTDEGDRSKIVTGFVNGKKVAYEVNDPWIARALRFEKEPISNRWYAKIFRWLSGATKELITRTPPFIAGQLLLDVSGAAIRETSWQGGPQHAPHVMKALVQSYFNPDLWRGLFSGDYHGDYGRFLREGGGMAGFQDMSEKALFKKQENLMRKNVFDGFEVKNKGDWGRVLKWLGTGEGMQAISSRLDMAPRVASMRLAEEKAAREGVDAASGTLKGMIHGRDITMDFLRGGTLTKMLNQYVPFFNIGFQSAAAPVRALRENPVAFLGTVASMIGVPTMAAEVWNRSDPQRAKDYEDIPDYIKSRNLIVMMPENLPFGIGQAGVDALGGRRPKYAYFPLREFGMFGVLARAAANKSIELAGGNVKDPVSWHQLGRDLIVTGSPVTANSPTDLTTSVSPVGLSSAAQLAFNRDAFRNRQIATDRNDLEASNISKGLAEGLYKMGYDIRPSQVEFLIRDMGGTTGGAALAFGDMVTGRAGKSNEGAQSLPVVGGSIKRFYGNATGQRLTEARASEISPDTRGILHTYGMRPDQIAPVPAVLEGIPLNRTEQTAWQQSFNTAFSEELGKVQQSSEWSRTDDKTDLIRKAASAARARTGKQLLQDIPQSERRDRKGG